MISSEKVIMDSYEFIETLERPSIIIGEKINEFMEQEIEENIIINYKPSFDSTTGWQKIISACVGSTITSFIVTPFDVIKTRLQFQSFNETNKIVPKPCQNLYFCNANRGLMLYEWPVSNVNLASSFEINNSLLNKSNLKFKGTIDAFFKIARFEGIDKLWRGLSPALLQSFPSTVIYYVGYDALRDELYEKVNYNPTYSIYIPLFAGALARSISATVISPIELFRTRLQSASKSSSFKDVSKDVIKMVRTHGVRSLWNGLTPTLWRDIPFSAIYWMGYEYIKKELKAKEAKEFSPFTNSFIAGAGSGIVAAIITTPFDVLKTRTQVNNNNHVIKKNGTFKIMKRIVRKEGIKELFRGLTPRVAKVAPACAIMVSTYEFGKAFFEKRNNI